MSIWSQHWKVWGKLIGGAYEIVNLWLVAQFFPLFIRHFFLLVLKNLTFPVRTLDTHSLWLASINSMQSLERKQLKHVYEIQQFIMTLNDINKFETWKNVFIIASWTKRFSRGKGKNKSWIEFMWLAATDSSVCIFMKCEAGSCIWVASSVSSSLNRANSW